MGEWQVGLRVSNDSEYPEARSRTFIDCLSYGPSEVFLGWGGEGVVVGIVSLCARLNDRGLILDHSFFSSCCHSFVKQSYCTGDAGKLASEDGQLEMLTSKAWEKPANGATAAAALNKKSDSDSSDDSEAERKKKKKLKRKMKKEKRKEKRRKKKKMKKKASEEEDDDDDDDTDSDSDEETKKKKKKKNKKKKKSSDSSDASSSEEDEDEETATKKKVEAAIKKQAKERREAEELLAIDERKRPYNSHYAYAKPTEEEMEAFRLKDIRSDDPMAQFLS